MKIVYIAASPIPARTANSVNVMKMCQAFADLGHDVTLIAERGNDDFENMQDLYSYYDVKNNFHILLKRRLFGIKSSVLLQKFIAALRLHPDYIHGRDVLCSFLLAQLGFNTSVEFHKPPIAGKKALKRLAIKATFTKLPQIIVNCYALKEHIAKNHPCPNDKIAIAHNGADTPVKDVTPIDLSPNDSFHCGYIGQLFQGKGMEVILPLAAACPWAQFHILGGTTEDIDFWRRKNNEPGNITFYGHKSQKEIARYRNAFDVMLAPYQNVVYGSGTTGNLAPWTSPIKVFEYMAASKAILASDLPVLREILAHNDNALLCRPEDIKQWQLTLEYLHSHPEEKQRLGKKAHQDFLDKHTWQKRAEKILENI